MEESQKKTMREAKARKREMDKQEVEEFQKSIQHSNLINLRMTTNFVKKARSIPKNSMV